VPLDERDYMRGKHPPACTCVDCEERWACRSKYPTGPKPSQPQYPQRKPSRIQQISPKFRVRNKLRRRWNGKQVRRWRRSISQKGMSITQRILLAGLGAIVALALQPLFPPIMAKWVNESQSYVLQLRQRLTEQQPAQPNLDSPIPDQTLAISTPTPAPFRIVITIPTPTPEPTSISNPSEDIEELREYILGLINEDMVFPQ
jgi:hypothetical protein